MLAIPAYSQDNILFYKCKFLGLFRHLSVFSCVFWHFPVIRWFSVCLGTLTQYVSFFVCTVPAYSQDNILFYKCKFLGLFRHFSVFSCVFWHFPVIRWFSVCLGTLTQYVSFFVCTVLTLYHTIPTFKDPEERAFRKGLKDKEEMQVTGIFFFSNNLFYPSQNKFNFFNNIYFVVCK